MSAPGSPTAHSAIDHADLHRPRLPSARQVPGALPCPLPPAPVRARGRRHAAHRSAREADRGKGPATRKAGHGDPAGPQGRRAPPRDRRATRPVHRARPANLPLCPRTSTGRHRWRFMIGKSGNLRRFLHAAIRGSRQRRATHSMTGTQTASPSANIALLGDSDS